MTRRATNQDVVPEVEVRITWRQWQDGRWEAWLTDGAGRPPHRVRSQAELERFLAQACQRELEGDHVESHCGDD